MSESAATLVLAGIVGALFTLAMVWLLRGRRVRPVEPRSEPYTDALRLLADGRTGDGLVKLQQAVVAGDAPADAYVRVGRLLRT